MAALKGVFAVGGGFFVSLVVMGLMSGCPGGSSAPSAATSAPSTAASATSHGAMPAETPAPSEAPPPYEEPPTFNAPAERPTDASATSLILILDTSGSMNDPVGNAGTKLDVAKDVLTNDFLPALADDLYTALFRFDGTDAVELASLRRNASLQHKKWLHREALMELVDGTVPSGGTPIVASLQRTRATLDGVPGRRVVVLVTDGEESYRGKDRVIEAIRANQSTGVETYIVGYNLGDQGRYLEAELGLGRGYFQANGGREALLAALSSILAAIEK